MIQFKAKCELVIFKSDGTEFENIDTENKILFLAIFHDNSSAWSVELRAGDEYLDIKQSVIEHTNNNTGGCVGKIHARLNKYSDARVKDDYLVAIGYRLESDATAFIQLQKSADDAPIETNVCNINKHKSGSDIMHARILAKHYGVTKIKTRTDQ